MKLNIYAFFITILWMIPSHSSDLSFRYYVDSKYTNVNIVQIGDLKVNEICKRKKNCKAVTVATGQPIKARGSTGPTYFHAGASYCWDVGAKNRILKDAQNNEYDFCVFDDGSMIDAWNLYGKHYPIKRIK